MLTFVTIFLKTLKFLPQNAVNNSTREKKTKRKAEIYGNGSITSNFWNVDPPKKRYRAAAYRLLFAKNFSFQRYEEGYKELSGSTWG